MLKTVLACNLKLKFGMGALSLIPVPNSCSIGLTFTPKLKTVKSLGWSVTIIHHIK